MTVESIDLEEGAVTLDLEDTHSPTSSWNGRSIHPVQPDQQIQAISNIVLHSVDKQSASTSEKEFTIVPKESALRSSEPTIILCGENVSGSVSVSGSVDTEGNKSAEVEIEVEDNEGTFSASASGSVTQDDDGNTEGRVEVKGVLHF